MDNSAGSNKNKPILTKLIWWAYLVTAVLAIPSLGFLITHTLHIEGFFELSVFIVACWFCTYLGMKLMSNPKFGPPRE
jgi:hypothetical protein